MSSATDNDLAVQRSYGGNNTHKGNTVQKDDDDNDDDDDKYEWRLLYLFLSPDLL